MNLVILSSVPNFVIVMIVMESIAMMLIGGFVVFDIIKGKKKEKQKELEIKHSKAQNSLDSLGEDNSSDFDGRLASLEKLIAKQKEYIELLEKEISFMHNQQAPKEESEEITEVEEAPVEEASASDDEFDEFLNSIPEKVIEEPKPVEKPKEEVKPKIETKVEVVEKEPDTKPRSVVISLSGLKKQSKAEQDQIKKNRLAAISEEAPTELEGKELEESFNVKVYHHEELKLEIDEPGTIKVFTKGGMKKETREHDEKIRMDRIKNIEEVAPVELDDDDSDYQGLTA